MEFISYPGPDVQAEDTATAITQVNHKCYHVMEHHLGYAGSLPGAASHHSSSDQPRDKTKRPKHYYTGRLQCHSSRRPCESAEPLTSAVTVLCEEKCLTVCLFVPLKSMTPNDGDSTTVADTKRAILSSVSGRYSRDAYNYVLESVRVSVCVWALSCLLK